jgi:AcrR family transcriptional regulator
MSSAKSSQPESSRVAILDAALAILAKEGRTALTVRRVASDAGCSTIGVYTWFGGMDGLLDAICFDAMTSFAAALRAAKPLRGRLGMGRAQAKAYRAWALAHPMQYRVMFLDPIAHELMSDATQAAAADAFQSLQDAVAEARRRDELAPTDDEAIAMAMWATVHGLVSLELTAGARPPEVEDESTLNDRAFDLAMKALVTGLVKPAEPGSRPMR